MNPGIEKPRKFPGEEASADLRQAASHIRQMFIALTQEGFYERQALTIVGQVLAASIQKPKDD